MEMTFSAALDFLSLIAVTSTLALLVEAGAVNVSLSCDSTSVARASARFARASASMARFRHVAKSSRLLWLPRSVETSIIPDGPNALPEAVRSNSGSARGLPGVVCVWADFCCCILSVNSAVDSAVCSMPKALRNSESCRTARTHGCLRREEQQAQAEWPGVAIAKTLAHRLFVRSREAQVMLCRPIAHLDFTVGVAVEDAKHLGWVWVLLRHEDLE